MIEFCKVIYHLQEPTSTDSPTYAPKYNCSFLNCLLFLVVWH